MEDRREATTASRQARSPGCLPPTRRLDSLGRARFRPSAVTSSEANRGAPPPWCTAVTPPRARRVAGEVYGPGVTGLRRDPPPHAASPARDRLPAGRRPSQIACTHSFRTNGCYTDATIDRLGAPATRRIRAGARARPVSGAAAVGPLVRSIRSATICSAARSSQCRRRHRTIGDLANTHR
jgi:hypothetical protein